MKRRLLFVVALAASALGFNAHAQTDITDQYLQNADLSSLEGWDMGDPLAGTKNDGVKNAAGDSLYYQAKTTGNNTEVPVIEFFHTWVAGAVKDGKTELGFTQNFHFTQKVTLPAGNYRLAVNAFYREGNGRTDDGQVHLSTKAFIFAGDIKEQGVYDAPSNVLNGWTGSADINKAANAFYNGKWSNEFDFDLDKETTLDIGFKGYINTYNSWCILGPVKLYKYELQDYINEFTKAKAEAEEMYDGEMNVAVLQALKDATNFDPNNATRDQIVAATQTLKRAIEAAQESVNAYAAFRNYIENEVSNNKVLQLDGEYVMRLQAYISDNEEPNGANAFPNGSAIYILDTRTLTNDELAAEKEWVEKLITETLRNSMAPGIDVSDLLVNPKFDNGFTGWTYSAGTAGGLKDFPCVERYGGTVDVSQTVSNVPDGIYSIACNAFERPGEIANFESWPKETKTYLFMNDFQTNVQSIADDAMPQSKAENYVNCFIEGDVAEDYTNTNGTTNHDSTLDIAGETNYVPNGMSGASYAFRYGRYEQKTYGLVEGGTMKVGLTSNGVNAHWVLWSNFTLTYEGKTQESVTKTIDALTPAAQAFMALNGEEEDLGGYTVGETMTTAAFNALTSKMAAAIASEKTGDVEVMWDALKAFNKAFADAKANIAVYAEFLAAQENLEEVYAEYSEEGLSDEQEAAYNDLQDEIGDPDNLTTDELRALIEKIKYVAGFLRIPTGYENASDAEPFDMTGAIVNPSFEDDGDEVKTITGWTYNTAASGDTKVARVFEDVEGERTPIYATEKVKDESGVETGEVRITGYGTYYVENADGYYVFNTWNGSVPSGGFWLAQTIAGLPAGTYEVSALVAGDAGNEISLETNTHRKSKATITVPALESDDEATEDDEPAEVDEDEEEEENVLVVGPKNIGHKVTNIFVLKEGAELEIKVTANGWFKADDFHLTYFGTKSEKIATDINTVEPADDAASAPVAIYTLAGTKVSSLQKGINIVKYSNGKVTKVLVK
ncbi:MAG: hypothetical protein J1F40_03085 [Prevotellaceae bacterium]|nr:hypothetical protein [Prevotellaceae bacterium]